MRQLGLRGCATEKSVEGLSRYYARSVVYPPHPRRNIGGRIIPLVEAEFLRHLRDGSSPETREDGSDDTEVMETEPPGESERDKRACTVETPEDGDVPEEPEAWDSGSEGGDDWEPESE